MVERVRRTAKPQRNLHGDEIPFGGAGPDGLDRLREPVIGMVTIARACHHWIERGTPDLDEVCKLLGMLDACGQEILQIIHRTKSAAEMQNINPSERAALRSDQGVNS